MGRTGQMTAAIATRVFVVANHAIVQRGITAYIDILEDLRPVGEAGNGREALQALHELAVRGSLPDVMLMDLAMPVVNGVDATGAITARFPSVHVVILTSFGDIERIHAALSNPAGYTLKNAKSGRGRCRRPRGEQGLALTRSVDTS